MTIFGILAKLLLNSLFLFYKPSEHKLSQVLLHDLKVFWQTRGAYALFPLDRLHDPNESAGMHKGITTDGDDSVSHGRKRILALLIDGAVFFRVMIKPVVFNVWCEISLDTHP